MRRTRKLFSVVLSLIMAFSVICTVPMTAQAAVVFIDCGDGKPEGSTFDNIPMILMPGETLTFYAKDRREDIITTDDLGNGPESIKIGERTTRAGGFLATEGSGLVATAEGDALVLRGGKQGNEESYAVIPITSISVNDVPVLVTAAPVPTDSIVNKQVTNDMGIVVGEDTLVYCSIKVEGLPAAGYDISYDLDGGKWTAAGQGPTFIKVSKEKQEIDSEDPFKPGYRFTGYTITSSHTTGGAIYVRGGDIIVNELKVGSNWEDAKTAMNRGTVKLKAGWREQSYSCSFDVNGGVISGDKPSYLYLDSYTDRFSKVSATKNGDEFAGWVCNGKLITSEDDYLAIFDNPSLSTINFKAKWKSETTPCELNNHDFTKYVSIGNGKHKVVCKNCDTAQEGHQNDDCSGGTATCTAKAKCVKCGEEYGNVLGHKYGQPTFAWTDYTSAKATFTCTNDANHKEVKNATITSVVTKDATTSEDGVKTYTAKVTFEGKDYTDTKTEVIPKLGDDKKPVAPKKNQVIEDKSGNDYKVTDPAKKEVTYKAPASKKAKTVTIPATVKIDGVTYKVTKIDDNAFKGNTTVTKITIPSTVTTIGKNAFKGCAKLTKITLSSKCTKIGANAFNGCKKMKTITIKSTKFTSKSVSANAFKGLSKNVTIKVPKKKLKAYKKLLKKKGFKGKVKA